MKLQASVSVLLPRSIPESGNSVSIPATWDRTFRGSGEDELRKILPTADSGYLMPQSAARTPKGLSSK